MVVENDSVVAFAVPEQAVPCTKEAVAVVAVEVGLGSVAL